MISGGTPETEYPTTRPRIGRPRLFATDLRAKSTAAAPSVTCEELPAVVEPPSLKAALNLLSPSTVVSFLIPSSCVTVILCTFPSLSLMLVLTGTISSILSLIYP